MAAEHESALAALHAELLAARTTLSSVAMPPEAMIAALNLLVERRQTTATKRTGEAGDLSTPSPTRPASPKHDDEPPRPRPRIKRSAQTGDAAPPKTD